MLKERVTVILFPEGQATARRCSIPYLALVPLVLVVLGALYGAGVLVYQREMILRQHRQAQGYADENAMLKRQNSLLSEEAARLAERVEDIAERTQRFETALGFDTYLYRSDGLGGPVSAGSLSQEGFTGRLHLRDLNLLSRETQGVDVNLREVEESFRARSELLAAVPSIPPIEGGVSSGFGYRFDPFTGVRAYHPALDISNDRGSPVVATAEGVVTEAGYEAGYGMAIGLMHGYGFSTRYAHLLGVKVKVGQRVKKGEIIGVVGSTGRSTGYHLHYEVRIKDEPVDPTPYMVEWSQQANFAARLEASLLEGAKAQERTGVNLQQ